MNVASEVYTVYLTVCFTSIRLIVVLWVLGFMQPKCVPDKKGREILHNM